MEGGGGGQKKRGTGLTGGMHAGIDRVGVNGGYRENYIVVKGFCPTLHFHHPSLECFEQSGKGDGRKTSSPSLIYIRFTKRGDTEVG